MATNTLFDIPQRQNDKQSDKSIVSKAKTAKKSSPSVRGGGGIASVISAITIEVERKLGQYKDKYQLIQSEELLHDYISECIGNGYISIDTETTGLDPLLDDLAGICIYSYGQKGSYIPINHVGYITNECIKNQLSMDFVASEFKRLLDKKPQIDMFNAVFDIRFLRHNQISDIYCTWDGSIAMKLMDENRLDNKLKKLHQEFVLKGKEDAFTFDELFKGVKFTQVPLDIAYLYAANDPVITTELCDFQRPYLTYDPTCDMTARNGMNGASWVFHNIEMPIVKVVADMEDTGILLDLDYNAVLKDKYHKLLDEREEAFHKVCDKYADKIQSYRNSVLQNCKLEDPINVKSTDQLAILFYDILGYDLFYDKKKKKYTRSTAEEQLVKLDTDITKAVLDYREFSTLVSTFIDKLPECVNPNDGRIHCKFNQYGAKCITGDSLLLTDKGYTQISNIFSAEDTDGEMISTPITIVNKNLQFECASHRVMYHDKNTIKLVLRGGYEIEGTPNHPVIISDLTLDDIQRNKSDRQKRRLEETQHFEQLQNINVGDTVAVPYGYNIFPSEYVKLDCRVIPTKTHNSVQYTIPEYCNEEFAELLGMYHADGTYKLNSDRFTISIHNKDKDVIDRVKYLSKFLFNIDANEYVGSKTVSTRISSLQIQEINKYLVKGARNKRIPDIIMRSPKSVVCAYIRGLTLDSSLDVSRQRLFISCMDKVSVSFIQSSLANMGILTQIRHGKTSSTRDHMGNEVDVISTYRIGVCGEMYDKFLSQIGFVQSSKVLHLDEYNKSQYLTYNNVYYAYVKDIQYGNADVYDLHIPNSHSFVANCLINHNTGRFSSDSPNLQNIPSHNKDIRKMFIADSTTTEVEEKDSSFTVDRWCEVQTQDGWVCADKVNVGDRLITINVGDSDNTDSIVSKVEVMDSSIIFYL